MENIILIAVLLVIIGLASLYVFKSGKKGIKCIGCPDGSTCQGKCSGCHSCSLKDEK